MKTKVKTCESCNAPCPACGSTEREHIETLAWIEHRCQCGEVTSKGTVSPHSTLNQVDLCPEPLTGYQKSLLEQLKEDIKIYLLLNPNTTREELERRLGDFLKARIKRNEDMFNFLLSDSPLAIEWLAMLAEDIWNNSHLDLTLKPISTLKCSCGAALFIGYPHQDGMITCNCGRKNFHRNGVIYKTWEPAKP